MDDATPSGSLAPRSPPSIFESLSKITKKRLTIAVPILGALALIAFAAAPHLLPIALSVYRSDIQFSVATKEKRLFLTIDDAPSTNTPEILRVLKKHGAPATFFIIADRVKSQDQLDEIIAAKHSLGNHLKSTKACSNLPMPEFRSDFEACSALIERGAKSYFFRPSSDFGTRDQIAYAKSRGYRTVAGTVFPMDHWLSDPDWLVRVSDWLTVRGGILILHDGTIRGHTTATVLDRLLPKLKAEGFVFCTLEE